MWGTTPGGDLAKQDGDPSASDATDALDDGARGLVSDLTDLKVQRKKKWSLNDRTQRMFSDLSRRLKLGLSENLDIPRKVFILIILSLMLILMLILYLAALGVAGRNDGTTTATQPSVPQSSVTQPDDAAPVVPAGPGESTSGPISGTEGSISSTAGPISGTWAMYWTNSKGSESQGFTIRFTGGDTGTLEILEDDTEFNTTFEVEGDQVMFEFTRTFQVPIGDWPEKSYFVGVLTGRNDMSGEWARQGWECWAKPVAGCASEVEWSRYPSHLIRMSE
jgi:hypothetical protein